MAWHLAMFVAAHTTLVLDPEAGSRGTLCLRSAGASSHDMRVVMRAA
jgi:hypothetical protein